MKTTLLLFILSVSTITFVNAQEQVVTPPQQSQPALEENSQEEPICSIPEVDADYPGGMAAMNQYLMENMVYPQYCLENEITGKVILQFIIEKDGSISHIEVKKEIHPLLAQESVRLVENMPKWIPAQNKGENVRSRTFLPISYSVR
ncbi:MAG: energy transducer TonB [Bacteroidetes bacterium]|nr:MAG: energy transducer TonB [Bacteroidota bacterium]